MAFKDESWMEVRVAVPPEAVDPVSGFLFDRGSLGVTEEEGSDPVRGPIVLLRSYFPREGFDRASFEQALSGALELARAGRPRIWVEELPYGDWAESWKQFFKPRRIGRRFLVAPSWEEASPGAGDLLLRIDPGMAFGTGQHETTALCLEVLEDLVGPGARVLDVGTGSGILAIGSVLLGAKEAVGIDLDPEAVSAARENVATNGLEGQVTITTTPLAEVEGEFEVVVANILADTIVGMATQLTRHLGPGGQLIVSGILESQAGRISDAFSWRLAVGPVRKAGEWICLTFRRS